MAGRLTRFLPAWLGLSLAVAAVPGHAGTLYADLGGGPGITAIASVSVDKYLADPRIAPLFVDLNIPRLKRLLALQFCQLAGGPCVYKGQNMRQAHAGLHLREADFNALVEDLEQAMDECRVPYAIQTRLLAVLAPLEPQVLGR
jgi:hemoglobin